MTGFRGAVDIDGRAWLKIDARLPYGHGGGPVFDERGLLIGVATQLAYAAGEPVAQVRPIGLAASIEVPADDLDRLKKTPNGP